MLTQNIKNVKIKVLLTGGGTAGPVTPLLALAESMPDAEFLWIGTDQGPEREMVAKIGVEFKAIAGGKWRRYFSLDNFLDIFKIIAGFVESLVIVHNWKPDIMVSAGGFAGVPVAFACKIMGIPIIIHQQDMRPGLANKIMSPLASVVTVTFQKSLQDYGQRAVHTGNPVRKAFKKAKISLIEARKKLNLSEDKPMILIFGGGTGSEAINKITKESAGKLAKVAEIIHLTGKEKLDESSKINGYHTFSFFDVDQMLCAYMAADIVVSRCGMSSLTEISYLSKSAIIIPMPDSHQEDNAGIFKQAKAAVVLDQKKLSGDEFLLQVNNLLKDKKKQVELGQNAHRLIQDGTENIISQIEKYAK